MPATPQNLRTSVLVCAALFVGYCAHAFLHSQLAVVEAQSRPSQKHEDPNSELAFQLSGIANATALTVYSPSEHTLYVYPAVTQGDSHVSCSFMLHIGRPGEPVDRRNCTPGPAY